MRALSLMLLLMAAGVHVRAVDRAESPVAEAAMRGDAARVRALLREGADVNAPQGDGMTALHWSALNGDADTVRVLLLAGATADPLTRVGRYTPLHLASSRGHGPVVARLLEAGSRHDALTGTGVQALHLAAQAGDPATITALLDRGADVNARDETHGRTPLIFATSQNRIEAMQVLLAKGADPRRATRVIDYRERSAADGEARQARNRIIAATTGRAAAAEISIDGAPVPAAARVGGGGAQDAGAEPGRRGGGGGGVRPPSDIEQIGRQGGFTPLHYAARDGHAKAAALLLDAGLDLNLRAEGDGSTPMILALTNGEYDLALSFLERGAYPNLVNDDGVGPLFATINNEWALRTWYPQPTAHQQQRASYLQVLESLLKAGADPNARTRSHIWYCLLYTSDAADEL